MNSTRKSYSYVRCAPLECMPSNQLFLFSPFFFSIFRNKKRNAAGGTSWKIMFYQTHLFVFVLKSGKCNIIVNQSVCVDFRLRYSGGQSSKMPIWRQRSDLCTLFSADEKKKKRTQFANLDSFIDYPNPNPNPNPARLGHVSVLAAYRTCIRLCAVWQCHRVSFCRYIRMRECENNTQMNTDSLEIEFENEKCGEKKNAKKRKMKYAKTRDKDEH